MLVFTSKSSNKAKIVFKELVVTFNKIDIDKCESYMNTINLLLLKKHENLFGNKDTTNLILSNC